MTTEKDQKIVNHFKKLVSKNKVVWVTDEIKKEATPKYVKDKGLSGTLKNTLKSGEALLNGLVCKTSSLGDINKQNIIVYDIKNQSWVQTQTNKYDIKKRELEDLEREVDALKTEIIKIGGRRNWNN